MSASPARHAADRRNTREGLWPENSPNKVRCLTDQKILISDEGGSEVNDLRVNGLPEGESPTEQQHAA